MICLDLVWMSETESWMSRDKSSIKSAAFESGFSFANSDKFPTIRLFIS